MIKIDEKAVVKILKNNDVVKAAFFGSYARGEATKNSDIDILIEFETGKRKSLFDLASIKLELEDLIQKEVDILTYRSINPLLKDYILKDERIIYEKR